MVNAINKYSADIEKVNRIAIVPTMLEVVCRSTGMGFAAIARVTDDSWIACSVRDEIKFGLEPGGELKLETTICNEIRGTHRAVVIDHVEKDEDFRHHHTPAMYGFQSYISVPIMLKNGEFFGTLCAIDPAPALLKNPKTIGMFNLFAELLSLHLHNIEMMDRSVQIMQEMNIQLTHSIDENRQYRHISSHNLQEPLRKIRVFSSMLADAAFKGDADKTRDLAVKVNAGAQRLSMMIKDLSEFSELSYTDGSFETVDLNKVVADVCAQLSPQLESKQAVVEIGLLPSLHAISLQMEQLFYHLINNAVKFSKRDVKPVIKVHARLAASPVHANRAGEDTKYVEILLEDNGIGIEKSQLEKVFDIFSQLPYDQQPLEGFGVGLAYCRKIIRNHGGTIAAQSEPGKGTTFSIVLPVKSKAVSLR
jgi:signal transduction histidine kinase